MLVQRGPQTCDQQEVHSSWYTSGTRDQGSTRYVLSLRNSQIPTSTLTLEFLELEFLPDVVNDLDVDFSADPAAAATYMNDQRNLRKVKEHTKSLQVNIINSLREGKRLLVLDIDYSRSFGLSCATFPLNVAPSNLGYETSHFRHFAATPMCAARPP